MNRGTILPTSKEVVNVPFPLLFCYCFVVLVVVIISVTKLPIGAIGHRSVTNIRRIRRIYAYFPRNPFQNAYLLSSYVSIKSPYDVCVLRG